MGLFRKGELKLLWPFYLESLIAYIIFFAPVFFIPYFIDIGFSMFQTGLLFSALMLSQIIMEIPTGVVADLYGRKLSTLLGYIIEGIGFLLIYFVRDFYSILFIFILIGLGSSFSSGAKEAWVIDLIKKNNKNLQASYFMKRQSFQYLGIIASGILGAFFVKNIGLNIIWPMACVSFFISGLILTFGSEFFIEKKRHKNNLLEACNQAKISFNYSKNHKVLFYIILASIFLIIAGNFIGPVSGVPLLKSLGFPNYAIGYFFSLIGLSGIIAPWISNKIYKKGKERKFIFISIIFSSLISLLIFFPKTITLVILFLIASEFCMHMRDPIQRIYFHKHIPSKLRATVGSLESMLILLGAAIAAPLAGFAVDHIGSRYTIFISGLLFIPAIICYLKIRK